MRAASIAAAFVGLVGFGLLAAGVLKNAFGESDVPATTYLPLGILAALAALACLAALVHLLRR
jgi:hypothetical protein